MIYVLLVFGMSMSHGTKAQEIYEDVLIFETQERCIRNLDNVKSQISKRYDHVIVTCVKKDINKGK